MRTQAKVKMISLVTSCHSWYGSPADEVRESAILRWTNGFGRLRRCAQTPHGTSPWGLQRSHRSPPK